MIGWFPGSGSTTRLDRRVLRGHAWFLGSTEAGKTSRGIAPLMNQLIRSNAKIRPGTKDQPCSIVVVDMKGDLALFHGAKIDAENAGMPFRWFTSVHGESSYVFNPVTQSHLADIRRDQFLEILLISLGLDYGPDYGRSYYTALNRTALEKVLTAGKDRLLSFKHIKDFINMSNT